MTEHDFLAERFEADRARLRGVAFRMLGSLPDADDALQEAWIRATRAGAGGVDNLGGWLTTVVARVCLDMLRSRKSRREEPLDGEAHEAPDARNARPIAHAAAPSDPEQEAALADSVGLALLVVLETLAPAERVAFVLHDLFGVPFEEIASIVGRTLDATRQLASRARRRVQGTPASPDADLARQRATVAAFLAALRAGDVEALVAVLDPDVVVRGDGVANEVRGARNWARGAIAFSRAAGAVRAALVDGAPGLVLAPHGKLARALRFEFAGDKIARVDVVADPARLAALEVAVLA